MTRAGLPPSAWLKGPMPAMPGEEEGLQGKPGEAAYGEAQGQGGAQEDQGRKGGQGEEVLAEAQADEDSGQDLGRGAGSGARPLNPA